MEREPILKNGLLGKELMILFLLTLLVRLVGIDHLPFDDEMPKPICLNPTPDGYHYLQSQELWLLSGNDP